MSQSESEFTKHRRHLSDVVTFDFMVENQEQLQFLYNYQLPPRIIHFF